MKYEKFNSTVTITLKEYEDLITIKNSLASKKNIIFRYLYDTQVYLYNETELSKMFVEEIKAMQSRIDSLCDKINEPTNELTKKSFWKK